MNIEISEPALRLTRRSLLISSASAAALLAVPIGRTGSLALAAQTPATTAGVFFDPATVHDIKATFDSDEYDAVMQAFAERGDKEWLQATVTIDGQTFEQVGLRLKGNSSLMGLRDRNGDDGQIQTFPAPVGTPIAENDNGAAQTQPDQGFVTHGPGGNLSVDEPEGLPWLVRLDKYVDDQNIDGLTEFVIRSNNSQTALNEALSLDLLAEAGLASQAAAYIRFSANGGDPKLRLAIENPDDTWLEAHFSNPGTLFKSEAEGNWTDKDGDLDAYKVAFDLEAGGSDDEAADYAPLVDFVEFLNGSDDSTFASVLPERLDVDQFAVYLSMMDLIENGDDISGPGNNSYLFYDHTTSIFTVVPWDMNLSFAGMGGPGTAIRTGDPGGVVTIINGTAVAGPIPSFTNEDGTPVAGGPTFTGPGGQDGSPGIHIENGDGPGGMGGMGGMNNPLVQKWAEVDAFTTLQRTARTRLVADLFQSGTASDILARWVTVLETHATDLIDQATIARESQPLQEQIDAI